MLTNALWLQIAVAGTPVFFTPAAEKGWSVSIRSLKETTMRKAIYSGAAAFLVAATLLTAATVVASVVGSNAAYADSRTATR